jgi:hypothetical protein
MEIVWNAKMDCGHLLIMLKNVTSVHKVDKTALERAHAPVLKLTSTKL